MKLLLAVTLACSIAAQERNKAEDWPASIEFKRAAIGSEYLTNSVIWKSESLYLKNYLVVEVGVYPVNRKDFLLKQEDFHLLVNGKKQPVYPQPATFVAGDLETETPVRGVDLGPGGMDRVIFGRPMPKPPKVPPPEDRTGVEKEAKLTTAETLAKAALYEGLIDGAVRGYLYFAFKAKPGTVKKVELVYTGGGGKIVLPLL